ncbi:phage tail protein [Trueperella pyogenes]
MVHLVIRLAVYAPNGGRVGVIANPIDWGCSFVFNALGALRFRLYSGSDDARLFDQPREVAVEYYDDAKAGWVEPAGGRFIVVESSTDKANGEAAVTTYVCRAYASLLDGVPVVPQKFSKPEFFDKDGKRKFLSATAGQILSAVMAEARKATPGLVPGVVFDFAPATDSAGERWNKTRTIYFEPGISLLTILENLGEQDTVDWSTVGRTVRVTNVADGETSGVHLGDLDSDQAPARSTIGGLVHSAMLVGDEGNVWKVDNSSGTPAPWGKTIKVITQGGVKDEATARDMVASELEAGSRERFEYTWQAPADGLDWLPFADVNVGDWAWLKTGPGFEKVRVYQITLSYSGDGIKVALTLNDRFEDAQVRAAKRLKGIVNGASGDAGTGSTPTRAEKAEPAQPVGIVAESEGYWEDMVARSLVRVGFAPVVLDVNGLGISIDHYEVNVAGVVVNTDKTSNVIVDGLAPDKTVTVQVVAVSSDGVRSKPGMVNVVTKRPDEKLAPPTKFTVEADFGIVDLIWDGKLQFKGGDPYDPPKHFKHIRVEESIDQRNWVTVGAAVAGGLTLDRQDQLGKTLYYRAKSVTLNGIESEDYGPVSEVVVRSRVSDELEKARRENADAIAQWRQDSRRLDEKLGTFRIPADRVDGLDSVIQAAASGTADITYSTSAPSGRGKKVGDVWWQKGDSGRIDGQWVWDGSTWVRTQIDGALVANLDVGRLTAGYGSLNEAVVRKLFAEVVTARVNQAGKFIGGDAILDGTVDASKVRSPEAWFKELFTDALMAGRVTSRMFSTDAAFEGPGVRIDRTGWQVTPSSGRGGIYANGEYGLFANDSDGNTTFHIKPTGEATFSGNLTSSATIKGVNLEGVTVTMKDGRSNGAVLTPSEIRYMEGGQNIGALSWRVLVAPPQGYIDCGETSVPNGGWSDLSFGYGGRQWAEFGMTVTSGGLVAPISGRYLVTGNAGVRGHGDSLVGVAVSTPGWAGGISVQTSQWAIGNGIEQTITATGVIDVRAGETIQLKIHNSGGAWATVGKASLFAKCISN